jgi:hypothetical protein
MCTPQVEAEVAALAKEAGVSHETARRALILNLLYARVSRARDTFFREHGRTPKAEVAWVRGMASVIGAGS